METKKVLTRNNEPSEELHEFVYKNYKGLELGYEEVYYLDFEVNEDTGMIDKTRKVKHYTKNQTERNIKALKNAYHIAKGAASPSEIISFRNRYHISASTFSVVLGFSKNTISNIEKDGITSLPTGRLIKMCLDNKEIVYHYLQVCDSIDLHKKQEISKRLLEV
jgi:DNA-binding transcriptional regulator YiaG